MDNQVQGVSERRAAATWKGGTPVPLDVLVSGDLPVSFALAQDAGLILAIRLQVKAFLRALNEGVGTQPRPCLWDLAWELKARVNS